MPPKKASKPKFKRAPGAPKRFKSAFMFFSESRHKQIRSESQDKKVLASEIAKVVSREWKSLSAEDRAVWEAKASEDRDRYYREKAAYKGPWKIPNVKDPRAPKKPMSSFLAFSNERRKAIADANPGIGNAEISGLLSKLWKESPEHVRNQYRDREVQERKKFKLALAEWEKKSSTSDLSSEDDENNSEKDPPRVRQESQPADNFQPNLHGSQSSLAQWTMFQRTGSLEEQPFQQNATQFAMFGSSSLDMASQLTFPTQQQLITLPPSSLPAPLSARSFAALPNQSFLSNERARSSIEGAGAAPTQLQQGTMDDDYHSLDPFIETDTGGFLAAFAALERGNQSNKLDQK